MRRFIDEWLRPRRFNLALFCAFASTTVLLAMMGLYGLVSYVVSQRAREIGLRMAIGANARDVQQMFLREAAIIGVTGCVLGVVLAAIARPFVSRLVASTDVNAAPDASINPAMATAIVVMLIAVVLLAAWLPARRASRVDPTLALRGQ